MARCHDLFSFVLSGEMLLLSGSDSGFDVPWQTEETGFDPIKHPRG